MKSNLKKMKFKHLLLFLSFILLSVNSFSQETNDEFKAYGKPFIKIYTNYHSTFTGGDASREFEIQRAYFGYQYYLSDKISGVLTLDVGDPKVGDLEMTAYLKTAYIQYKNNGLTAMMGMIGLYQFKMQENLWGGRYLYKSFMDEYKFGPSADLGAFVAYSPNDFISLDLTIANGEGYKKIESDSILKYSAGITLSPLKGLDFRASYDYMGKDSAQQTMAFYLGYTLEKLRFGAEYNVQYNHKMADGEDLTGLSFYGSYSSEKARFFARYDNLSSATLEGETDPWHYGSDGQAIITGVEFNPVKGLLITPNYEGWIPADGGDISHGAYLSLEIKF